jgi:hypothetical protein
VLLARLGLSAADLLAAPAVRRAVPTFADYVPVVARAVGAGTRRVYGSQRLGGDVPGQRQLLQVVRGYAAAPCRGVDLVVEPILDPHQVRPVAERRRELVIQSAQHRLPDRVHLTVGQPPVVRPDPLLTGQPRIGRTTVPYHGDRTRRTRAVRPDHSHRELTSAGVDDVPASG